MTYSVHDFYGKNQKELAEAIWQKDVKRVEELAPHTDLHTLSKKICRYLCYLSFGFQKI